MAKKISHTFQKGKHFFFTIFHQREREREKLCFMVSAQISSALSGPAIQSERAARIQLSRVEMKLYSLYLDNFNCSKSHHHHHHRHYDRLLISGLMVCQRRSKNHFIFSDGSKFCIYLLLLLLLITTLHCWCHLLEICRQQSETNYE